MSIEIDYPSLDYGHDLRVYPDPEEDGDIFLPTRHVWAVKQGDSWAVLDLDRAQLGVYASAEEAVYSIVGLPAELVDESGNRAFFRLHLDCDLDSENLVDHRDLVVIREGHRASWTAGIEYPSDDDLGPATANTPEEAVTLFFRIFN